MGSGYSREFKDSIGCLSERYDHKDMNSKRNLGKKVNWRFEGFIRVGTDRIRDSPSSSKGMRNPEDLVQDIRGTVFVIINARPPSIVLEIWVNQIRLIHYDEGIIGLLYLIFGGFLESLAGFVESGSLIF